MIWILLITVEAEETELESRRSRSANQDLRKEDLLCLAGDGAERRRRNTVYLISSQSVVLSQAVVESVLLIRAQDK